MPSDMLDSHRALLSSNKDAFKKHIVTRVVLTDLNRMQNTRIKERREVLKRVSEFENFSACWESDREPARTHVRDVRDLIHVKDSFAKMEQVATQERQARMKAAKAEADAKLQSQKILRQIGSDLGALFSLTDRHARGKALEGVLNRLCKHAGILIEEDFTVRNDDETIVEQIDGAIKFENHTHLVEMKWHTANLGPGDVARHVVRVCGRPETRGILISNTPLTPGALQVVQDGLKERVFFLIDLEEVVQLISREIPLQELLRAKSEAAEIHRNPYYKPIGTKLGV